MLNLIYIEHKPTFTLFAARIGRAVCLLNLVSGLAADKLRAAMAYLLYGDTASWSLYDFIYIARVQTMNSTSMPRDNRALRITLMAARIQIQKKKIKLTGVTTETADVRWFVCICRMRLLPNSKTVDNIEMLRMSHQLQQIDSLHGP